MTPRCFQHLIRAGKLLNTGQLDDAANGLTIAINGGDGKAKLGFVVGMILMNQGRYEDILRFWIAILLFRKCIRG
jgi:hypothetical protein